MLKKEQKTHQSPSSHQVPKLKLMKKEKLVKIFIFFFLFWTVSTEDWSFGGWEVGNGTSANESVSKKTKQKNKK